MYLALSATLAALAAALVVPGLACALRAWARRLSQSRRATLERRLPEAFLFVDSRGTRYCWYPWWSRWPRS